MKLGPINLTWWRKRPSVHVADVPLRAEELPWFEDPRESIRSGKMRDGLTFHEPGSVDPAAQRLPLVPIAVGREVVSPFENQLKRNREARVK